MPPPLKGIVFRLIHNPGRYIPLCTDYSLCRGSFPCNWPWVFAQPKLDGSGSVFALWPSAVPCSPFSDPVTEVQRQRLNVSLSNTHINQSAPPPSSFHIPLLRNVGVVCRKKIVIIITRPHTNPSIHPSIQPWVGRHARRCPSVILFVHLNQCTIRKAHPKFALEHLRGGNGTIK